jgi:hypothetical protein
VLRDVVPIMLVDPAGAALAPGWRLRAFTLTPTAVKRSMSNDSLERAQHRIRPQLTKPPSAAGSILPASRPAQAVEAPHQMALDLTQGLPSGS